MTSYIKRPLIPQSNIMPMKAVLQELTLESIDNQFTNLKNHYCAAPQHIERRIDNLLENLFKTKYGQIDFKYNIDGQLINPITGYMEPPYQFRIRKANPKAICKGDFTLTTEQIFDSLEFADMNCENDMWARPSSMVTDYGRLHKPNQSVLYTSLDGSTTIVEADVDVGDFFFIVCYKRVKPMQFSDCTRFVAFEELTEEENLKRYVMFNLLVNEFTKEFPKTYNKQHQYCLSSNVADYFFNYPDIDAIQYPSVKKLGNRNFAYFDDKARKCLTPICVKFCRFEDRIDDRPLIKFMYNGFWIDNRFVWAHPNSNLSKEKLNDPVLEMFLTK